MLFAGQSLWDEKSVFSVVLDKKTRIPVNGPYNGLLLTVLYYYIYNLEYPENLVRTLEFLQR